MSDQEGKWEKTAEELHIANQQLVSELAAAKRERDDVLKTLQEQLDSHNTKNPWLGIASAIELLKMKYQELELRFYAAVKERDAAKRDLAHECPKCQMSVESSITQDGCIGCEAMKLREAVAQYSKTCGELDQERRKWKAECVALCRECDRLQREVCWSKNQI